ncbi:flagellar hook-basal body protein [Planctomicrobium sp. SH527]|uniref:flagellar hook-basal body protein n=1 Tax=Planctomicrobium sp. SH527 TaxID=3448123 RepID=UPI003F5C2DC0
MINGLYSAASAMEAAARQHELIAQNLAHAQMPGYRRQSLIHDSKENQFDQELKSAVNFSSHGVHAGETYIDFSSGPLEKTGHHLDVALDGEGFFVVEGPDGPLYTRNGAFHLNEGGQLVTVDNLPVQAGGQNISIPPNTASSSIRITEEGRVFANNIELGKIDVVRFAQPDRLKFAGATLFQAPTDLLPEDAEAVMHQGTRERSNVSPVHELVDMIAVQRRQEAAQKSMTLINEAIGRHILSQGGV